MSADLYPKELAERLRLVANMLNAGGILSASAAIVNEAADWIENGGEQHAPEAGELEPRCLSIGGLGLREPARCRLLLGHPGHHRYVT